MAKSSLYFSSKYLQNAEIAVSATTHQLPSGERGPDFLKCVTYFGRNISLSFYVNYLVYCNWSFTTAFPVYAESQQFISFSDQQNTYYIYCSNCCSVDILPVGQIQNYPTMREDDGCLINIYTHPNICRFNNLMLQSKFYWGGESKLQYYIFIIMPLLGDDQQPSFQCYPKRSPYD